MEVVLKNQNLAVKVSSLGAELQSIKGMEQGIEYLYQPDGRHWNRQSPILFPIIGKLIDGQYEYLGEHYQLGKHGFARDKEFRVVLHDEERAVFELTSEMANETEAYPFTYTLRVTYELRERALVVWFTLVNQGLSQMWFSMGGHPAFAVPLEEGIAFEDYQVTVTTGSGEGPLERLLLDGPFIASLDGKEYPNHFPLSHECFSDDALIFRTTSKTQVSLTSDKGSAAVHLKYTNSGIVRGFPYVGIWSMTDDSPFVCIEPWDGLPDRVGTNGTLIDKVGVNCLAPGGVYRNLYVIEVEG